MDWDIYLIKSTILPQNHSLLPPPLLSFSLSLPLFEFHVGVDDLKTPSYPRMPNSTVSSEVMRLEVCATTPGHQTTIFLYFIFDTNFQQFEKDAQDIEARALSMVGQNSTNNVSPYLPKLFCTTQVQTRLSRLALKSICIPDNSWTYPSGIKEKTTRINWSLPIF